MNTPSDNPLLDSVTAYMTSSKGQRFIKTWWKKTYPPPWSETSPLFIRTLVYLRRMLNRYDRVDMEDFHYRRESMRFGKLTESAFCRLHSSLWQRRKDEIVDITDRSEPPYVFTHEILDYSGLRFHLLIGQGSAVWVTKTP